MNVVIIARQKFFAHPIYCTYPFQSSAFARIPNKVRY